MNRRPDSDHHLLFRCGLCIGAIDLAHVREVMRPLPVQDIASTPEFVMGVAIVRGTPSPVINAARLLEAVSGSPAVRPTRFISFRLGPRSACLAVESVLDVRRLPPEQLGRTPPLLGESCATLLPLVGSLDAQLLVLLDTARLVPEAVWASMQAREGCA